MGIATAAVEHNLMQPDTLAQVALQTILLAILYAVRKFLKDAAFQVRPEPREAHGPEARRHRQAHGRSSDEAAPSPDAR
jgi:hypothetical protein